MISKKALYQPIVLIILDGWGISPAWGGNAISSAKPRYFGYYWRNYPHLVLEALAKISKLNQIVPDSRVGHEIIGTGRLIFPNSIRISNEIVSGAFFDNRVLEEIAAKTFELESDVHLIGLFSAGGIESNLDHLAALVSFFKNQGVKKVFIHAILDGLDSPPNTGIGLVSKMEGQFQKIGLGKIVTLMGRDWGQTSDNSKISKTLRILTKSEKQNTSSDCHLAIKDQYLKKIYDSQFLPTIILTEDPQKTRLKKQDLVIFFNFEGQNIKPLAEKVADFLDQQIYTLTDYQITKSKAIIEKLIFKNSLVEVLSKNNIKVLKVAESCKQKHLTDFFNGEIEKAFPNEKRIIFPTSTDYTPEEFPAMRAYDIAGKVVDEIKKEDFKVIVVNFANVDAVAHSGNILATEKAIHYTDDAMAHIVETTLIKKGIVLITSDHGNAESLGDLKNFPGQFENFHTLNPVPLMAICPENKSEKSEFLHTLEKGSLISQMVAAEHSLADIAPTVLDLLGIEKPAEMRGKSLWPLLREKVGRK